MKNKGGDKLEVLLVLLIVAILNGCLTYANSILEGYKKKARNIVIFYIIAESVWQIKDIVVGYYM